MERRRSPRLSISFPVACNMLLKKRYFYTVSKNLGLGGLGILCNRFVPSKSLLKISINLINRIVILKAKVVWCSRRRISERYSVGLEFVEINGIHRQNIDHFLQSMPLI